jgi:phosphatidylglycerol:prolipoprotein diacylglycerol transferase
MIPVLLFPQFDPVLIQIGPIAIRWYALAYICSLLLGWRIMRRLVLRTPAVATMEQTDDFLTWATLGVVLGGRLGYVLFYQPELYLSHPLAALQVWQGGMSFHGGALGVMVALVIYCRKHAIPLLGFGDRIAIVVPIGLGLGRIANFINGELWGRPAPDWLPWAMIFPNAGPVWLLGRRESIRARFGVLTGVFLAGYAIARSTGELFRQPDAFLGFLFEGATMGQLLSLPMLIAGIWLILRAQPRQVVVA